MHMPVYSYFVSLFPVYSCCVSLRFLGGGLISHQGCQWGARLGEPFAASCGILRDPMDDVCAGSFEIR